MERIVEMHGREVPVRLKNFSPYPQHKKKDQVDSLHDLPDAVFGEIQNDLTKPVGTNHLDLNMVISNDSSEIDPDDSIALYLKEVGGIPLLSREEEVSLAKSIEQGRIAQEKKARLRNQDDSSMLQQLDEIIMKGQAANEHLIKANSRLVISMAKKYMGQGVDYLDLIQEGNLGLMRAVDKFDYRRGYKFSTYATWWIRQALTRGIANQSRAIRLPIHISNHVKKTLAVSERLEGEFGRKATIEEIAVELDKPVEKVRNYLKLAERTVTLDLPVGEDQLTTIADYQKSYDNTEQEALDMLTTSTLKQAMECLTMREARIITLRYGLFGHEAHLLSDVGKKFGLTKERIRQIEKKAIKKLKRSAAKGVLSGLD